MPDPAVKLSVSVLVSATKVVPFALNCLKVFVTTSASKSIVTCLLLESVDTLILVPPLMSKSLPTVV